MLRRIYFFVGIVATLAVGVAVAGSLDTQQDQQKERPREVRERPRLSATQVDGPNAPMAYAFSLGEGSYLGVYLEEVTAERAKTLGLTEERGALVMKVVEGSPADKAGLKENDVVVEFNGRRVDSVREFQRLLNETPPDRNVTLAVVRGGSHQTLNATLSKRSQNFKLDMPQWDDKALKDSQEAFKRAEEAMKDNKFKLDHDFGNFTFVSPGEFGMFRGGRLGVGVESLTDQLAEYFGVKDGRGVLVSDVDANGAAGKAGIKAGDIIVGVDDAKVDSVNALMTAINKKTDGPVTLRIVRNRKEQTVTVNLEKRPAPPVAPRRSRAAVISSLTDAV